MTGARAFAKLNLALVVGPLRPDGKHEVVTVLERLDLHDDVELEPAAELRVEGYAEDTLVRQALQALADAAGVSPHWEVRIEKRIPVAAGLGGGSSDAAAALELANASLSDPVAPEELHEIAARVGADVPFFLRAGPQRGTADGTVLEPLELPRDYVALLVLPAGKAKESTATVYRTFDERNGARGFDERREALLEALASMNIAGLPKNDLASSPLTEELEGLGAFRADVTGAGPVVYGLFERAEQAERAASTFAEAARTWIARPVPRG